MKNIFKSFLILIGTLTLQVPDGFSGINDGTLPLMLMGNAIDLNNQDSLEIAATLHFRTVGTIDLDEEATFECSALSATQTRHSASGIIRVGSQKFAIKGICVIDANGRQKIEVIGKKPGMKALLSGFFSERDGRRLVTGRLQILQGRRNTGRFEINVRSNQIDLLTERP